MPEQRGMQIRDLCIDPGPLKGSRGRKPPKPKVPGKICTVGEDHEREKVTCEKSQPLAGPNMSLGMEFTLTMCSRK